MTNDTKEKMFYYVCYSAGCISVGFLGALFGDIISGGRTEAIILCTVLAMIGFCMGNKHGR